MTRRVAAWLLSLIMITPLLVLALLSVAVQWRIPRSGRAHFTIACGWTCCTMGARWAWPSSPRD